MTERVPIAMIAGMRIPHPDDDDPDRYPGSKQVRRALSGESADPWEHYPHVVMIVRGTERRFYALGLLASLLERKPSTIRKWESLGHIPRATWRFPGGASATNAGKRREGQRRLYTREQIEGLVRLARSTGVVPAPGVPPRNVGGTEFPDRARALFEELRGT